MEPLYVELKKFTTKDFKTAYKHFLFLMICSSFMPVFLSKALRCEEIH